MKRHSETGDPFAGSFDVQGEEDPAPKGFLGNRYEVLEERRGGMGVVYICRLQKPEGAGSEESVKIAAKTFQKRLFFNSQCRIAFLIEAKLWTQLSDIPHIMPVLGIEEIDGRPFILMPAVPPGPNGEISLHDYLGSRSWEASRTLRVALEVSLAMRLADAEVPGVVHGDLKPQNLLLAGDSVLVADFGLARAGDMPAGNLGLETTWAYQAPETFAARELTQKSDIYAFGATLMELLSGKPPFEAAAREEFAACHATQTPSVPETEEPLERALIEVAMECLAKDPNERPESFAAIYQKLGDLAQEQDPVQLLMTTMKSAHLKHSAVQARTQTALARASGLLEIGEHQAALEVIEAIPEDELDGETRILKGTALSLSDRDEEAVVELTAALGTELEDRQRHRALCELALSFKRLGRFTEAIDLFKNLQHQVPEELLPNVVINLATAHMQCGQLDEGERLLTGFVRRHPDQPLAWTNRGWIRERLGRPAEALEDYGRALSLAPGTGEALVRRAAVLMDYLDRTAEAWMALDTAFDQGFESREWFVRSLACTRLLGLSEQEEVMLSAARTNIGTEVAASMEEEATAMVTRIRAGGPPVYDLPATQAEQPAQRDAGEEDGGKVAEFRMPFLNYRFYLSTGKLTLDFYDDTESESYVDHFRESWYQATREGSEMADMSTTPLYFTSCPGCGLRILTNRVHGKALRCRRCETIHDSLPLDESDLALLLEQVYEAVGLKLDRLVAEMLVVVFQASDAEEEAVIAEACEKAGFEQAPERHAMVMQTTMEGVKRGVFDSMDRIRGWQKRMASSELAYEGRTPPEVERLIEEIRLKARGVRSMSTNYELNGLAPMMAASLTGDFVGAQQHAEQMLRESPASGGREVLQPESAVCHPNGVGSNSPGQRPG